MIGVPVESVLNVRFDPSDVSAGLRLIEIKKEKRA